MENACHINSRANINVIILLFTRQWSILVNTEVQSHALLHWGFGTSVPFWFTSYTIFGLAVQILYAWARNGKLYFEESVLAQMLFQCSIYLFSFHRQKNFHYHQILKGPHNYCLASTILQFQGLLLPNDLLKAPLSDETVRTKFTDIILQK